MLSKFQINIKKAIRKRSTFKEYWNQIKETANFLDEHSSKLKDTYFEEKPKYQEFLTKDNCTFPNKIEFSSYSQISLDEIAINNIYECFHGILFYIFYYSDNKLNTEEIEFHYSGSKSRQSLSSLEKKTLLGVADHLDILNIFDYMNINREFQIRCTINAFFGVTFKRIKILPMAYSIRSGVYLPFKSHLVSFTFEGYDEIKQIWEVLDERENINNLIPSGGYMIFYVRETTKYYSSFKIKQTSPGSDDIWGFTIAAFDIHGIVMYRDNNCVENLNLDVNYTMTYDPMMDMTQYI